MKHHQFLFLLFVFSLSTPIFSQSVEELLDTYIQTAIAENHALKQQDFLLEKNVKALTEAERLFFPEVNFGASYTLAVGGRSIAFPVGDLLNPVYSTLNQLTQTTAFPQIENVNEQFFPTNFYDARFRIIQPLVNREIYFNKKIKAEQINLKQAEINVFKRELVRDVKVAYFRFQQASEATKIYDSALELLAENQRVNESLLRNDKVIPSVLLRVKSEVANVEAQKNQVNTNVKNAQAYFNFLLNRALDTEIQTTDTEFSPDEIASVSLSDANDREELEQLATAQKMNALLTEMEQSFRIPKVGVQVDLGSQNFDFDWGGYVLGGLSVEVPIYAGGRNRLQIEQAQLEGRAIAENTEQVEAQIELQTTTTRNTLLAELETYRSYASQVENARRQYQDTFRRYREGVSNYIEVLDARTQVTNIELQRNVAKYNVLIQEAELERVLAIYKI